MSDNRGDGLGGKIAIVTGAARGIGRATARRLALSGAHVLLADRDLEPLRQTAESLVSETENKQTGETRGDIAHAACDVTNAEAVQAVVQEAINRWGRLDIFVANAGIADAKPFLDLDEASWHRVLGVNLTGTFLSIREAARTMVALGNGGTIVVTASTNAFFVETNLAHYNTSKGGVIALVRSAALDLAPHKIRVNAVEPGVVNTRLAEFVTSDPHESADYLRRIPLDRFAEPDDVADAVLFLASDRASYITGQALVLDGGLTLGIPLALPATPILP